MKEIKGEGRSYKKLSFYLIGLVICLMVIIAFIKFGTVLFLLPVWIWLSHAIVNATGINIWLAKTLSALLILPLIYIVSLLFSWKKKKRKVGITLLSLATAAICLSMFFITKDTYFSFKSGKATKWYIITPQGGYKFSTSPGFDPVWGRKYKMVTPQVVEEYNLQKQSTVYAALPKDQYFDRKTGKAVKWYAILPDSTLELFTSPGVHPKYGMKLKPINREIVVKLVKGEIELKEVKAKRKKKKIREKLSRLKKIKSSPKEEVKKEGRPYLGISYKYVDEISIELPVDYGVVVLPKPRLNGVAVEPGSPADKAGIKEGDIILELNNIKLSRKHDLTSEISKLSPGDRIKLKFLRLSESTKKRLIEIELGYLKKRGN